jgi:hypothetical protein
MRSGSGFAVRLLICACHRQAGGDHRFRLAALPGVLGVFLAGERLPAPTRSRLVLA